MTRIPAGRKEGGVRRSTEERKEEEEERMLMRRGRFFDALTRRTSLIQRQRVLLPSAGFTGVWRGILCGGGRHWVSRQSWSWWEATQTR